MSTKESFTLWRIPFSLLLGFIAVISSATSDQYDLLIPVTVYPKKYAHGFCFAVLCCGYTLTDFPISIRLTSLALWQSNDCPSASKATLMNMDKYFMWIHYERLHNHNKTKHNKTVCIFLGIYCIQGYQMPVEITWLIWANRHGLSPIKTLQNMEVNIIFWKIILLSSKFDGTGRYNVTNETTTLLSWRVPKIVSGLLSRMEYPCIKLKIPWYGVRDRFYDDVIKWKHFPRYWPFMRVIP